MPILNSSAVKKYTFALLLIFAIVIINFQTKNIYKVTQEPFILKPEDSEISCHDTPDTVLISADDLTYPNKSIFFIETSCHGTLNSKQACAVESAAKQNPTWQINVLFVGPLNQSLPLHTLKSFNNIRFARINRTNYSKGTPLEKFFSRRILETSEFAVSHASDIFRFLTLYKYGGLYLDLDVIVVRSFEPLPRNFVTFQDSDSIASFIIAMSRDGIGRNVSEACIKWIAKSYDPLSRNSNGPFLLDQAVKELCNTNNFTQLYPHTECKEFYVFNYEYFAPQHYSGANVYLVPVDSLPKLVDNEFTHHFWNAMKTINMPKNCYYVELAKKYCPAVYDLYGVNFGT